ncbi:MucR family transcriptional regulator [Methylorubrum extorquens]|uniref:MucR family transcriptional regulator n=1 Tax=Methylorubrum extorquens TaxID=408 RepID=UPI003F623A5D
MSDDNFEDAATNKADIIYRSAAVTAAYITKNTISARDLPALITSVHAALAGLGNSTSASAAENRGGRPTPTQIRKSITTDAIVSFIDGKAYKTLKRHLSANGLDPQSYRQRYGLPDDYPMVAPNYAARRSDLAKSLGFGRQKFVRK